jgi:hypothetical protein
MQAMAAEFLYEIKAIFAADLKRFNGDKRKYTLANGKMGRA